MNLPMYLSSWPIGSHDDICKRTSARFLRVVSEDSTESNKSSFSPCLTAVFPYTQAHKQKN